MGFKHSQTTIYQVAMVQYGGGGTKKEKENGGEGEGGCYPNETTFLVLIRSLYQAARLEEGDEMIDRMRSAGFGEFLDKKAYYQFLKILCGIERVDHALSVFAMMKDDGCGHVEA